MKFPSRSRAVSRSIPAPVGGWNARDSIADMDPNDAVILSDMWPTTSDVMVRNGYTQWATGLPSQVESLMPYSGGATSKLFAASGSAFYDATAGGAVGAAVLTGLSNARWQSCNIATAANNYLVCVNGTDKVRYYTGSVWAKDGDGAPYDVTGVNTASCIGVFLHKTRLWYIESGTLKAWYLGAGALGGAASALDMRAIPRKGGYIVAGATWTIDAG